MSPFLSRLLDRSAGTLPVARAVLPPLFGPAPLVPASGTPAPEGEAARAAGPGKDPRPRSASEGTISEARTLEERIPARVAPGRLAAPESERDRWRIPMEAAAPTSPELRPSAQDGRGSERSGEESGRESRQAADRPGLPSPSAPLEAPSLRDRRGEDERSAPEAPERKRRAPAPAASPTPGRASSPVRITIGRIEIKAVQAEKEAAPRVAAPRPAPLSTLSLEAYLRSRGPKP
jgi:hypothetical protein